MLRNSSCLVLLILMLLGASVLSFNIQPIKASGTIYIRADGSIDPPTAPIQRDGDVYAFTSDIFESIIVERDDIVIDGSGRTLQGPGSHGVELFDTVNVTVRNMEIVGFSSGVFFANSSHNWILGNNITDNGHGIGFEAFSWNQNNTILSNRIADNNNGIYLVAENSLMDYNNITMNAIMNNSYGISLVGYKASARQNMIKRNNITANGVGIDLSVSVDGNTITENVITRNGVGIQSLLSANTIANNTISMNTGSGLKLTASSGNNVSNNNITDNGNGTILDWAIFFSPYFSHSNNIVGNRINNNNDYGVLLSGSSLNMISGNQIANNTDGIYLDDVYVEFEGVFYRPSNSNSIVSNNVIANSRYGLQLINTSDNLIYHNNLVNNTDQIFLYNSSDLWDNGCEGNYWSNYNGLDTTTPADGIGDTLLPWEGVDFNPLMNPYWNPCDINHDMKVNMRDIGSAARAFGTELGDTRWNCHADITGPTHLVPDGKVDMRDIGLIASRFGQEY